MSKMFYEIYLPSLLLANDTSAKTSPEVCCGLPWGFSFLTVQLGHLLQHAKPS